ncbi:hypothetical protein DICTH_1731 [Dictyoglomus thermophilum H-6-12]|uniref:Uncharacterized protein n=1 Tax=Dictyoglomus thermophilum (strain ATCC 35947 / DSM 3960 / H-6-12) TaxID=309799 RepID=B5YB17_DICT6|nr:hypothetical protein DICTH_1731 [Dictyoglomus thermophilum H-6-12]
MIKKGKIKEKIKKEILCTKRSFAKILAFNFNLWTNLATNKEGKKLPKVTRKLAKLI